MRTATAKFLRNKNGTFSVKYRGKIVLSRADYYAATLCWQVFNHPPEGLEVGAWRGVR